LTAQPLPHQQHTAVAERGSTVQINVNKMKIFRPILNRYLSPTIKNVHGRLIKPMVSLACPIDFAMKTKTSQLSLSTTRFLSDQSIDKTEQKKEEVGKSADTDALEVDVSQFTEEVPIYLPGERTQWLVTI
jgi:hypothetical protein